MISQTEINTTLSKLSKIVNKVSKISSKQTEKHLEKCSGIILKLFEKDYHLKNFNNEKLRLLAFELILFIVYEKERINQQQNILWKQTIQNLQLIKPIVSQTEQLCQNIFDQLEGTSFSVINHLGLLDLQDKIMKCKQILSETLCKLEQKKSKCIRQLQLSQKVVYNMNQQLQQLRRKQEFLVDKFKSIPKKKQQSVKSQKSFQSLLLSQGIQKEIEYTFRKQEQLSQLRKQFAHLQERINRIEFEQNSNYRLLNIQSKSIETLMKKGEVE